METPPQHNIEHEYPPTISSYNLEESKGVSRRWFNPLHNFIHLLPLSCHDPEESKVVLRRSFNPLRNVIHLLALVATILVLWLNFSEAYWADENNWQPKWYLFDLNQEDTFNFLQFYAKVHEIFVVGSVSAMVLHCVRRKLVGKGRGLPFGLVVGAYQAGSAEYFASKSLWTPLFQSICGKQWNEALVALMIGMSIIYANMAGPASAALLIPTLDWYSVKDPFNGLPLTTYIWPKSNNSLTEQLLYPQFLDLSISGGITAAQCADSTDINNDICPGAGFSQLDFWFDSWATSGIRNDPSMDVLLGKIKRQVASRVAGANETEPGIAVASTLHTEIALVLDLFSQYVNTNPMGEINQIQRPKFIVADGTPAFSPLVQAQCGGMDQRTALQNLQKSGNLSFSTGLMQNFSREYNGYKSNTWQVPTGLWSSADASTNDTDFTWIPASDIRGIGGETISTSIAALARVPVFMAVNSSGTTRYEQDSLLVSCVLDARWAATAVSYDSKQSDAADFNLTNPTQLLNKNGDWKDGFVGSDFGVSDLITLDTEWAALLNLPKPINNNGTSNATIPAIPLLLSRFIETTNASNLPDGEDGEYKMFVPVGSSLSKDEVYANISATIAVLLSTLVGDGISRTNSITNFELYIELTRELANGTTTLDDILRQAGKWDISPITNYPVSNMKGLERLEFHVQRYGWGYSLQPRTAKFAATVLLLHVAMLLIFQATSLLFLVRGGWISQAWGDIGELFALAAGSQESEAFRNTGAGIDKGRTWMINVRIRERNGNRVEAIFDGAESSLSDERKVLKPQIKYS